MLVIDLFSGIGGFSLSAEWMNWETALFCEIDEFCRKVLQYYWPNAYHHKDIKTFTYETINTELTKRYGVNWKDNKLILTGGFPCPSFSLAGKRKGTEDDRYLWPQMFETIRVVHPDWIVAENVPGIITWGGEWYSSKCILTWKKKDTRYFRSYFQLAVSTPHIKEIGSGLLPTTRARDGVKGSDRKLTLKDSKWQNLDKNGIAYGMTLEQAVGLLPTPLADECIDRTSLTHGQRSLGIMAKTGLMPTPQAMESPAKTEKVLRLKEKGLPLMTRSEGDNSRQYSITDWMIYHDLLPTPTGQEVEHPEAELTETNRRKSKTGKTSHSLNLTDTINQKLLPTPREAASRGDCTRDRGKGNLEDVIAQNLIPTPASRDYKGARTTEALKEAGRDENNSLPDFFSQTGKTSQLNPLFVEEMMGYPTGWILKPFLEESNIPENPLPIQDGERKA
jgi:site-specific DNA-cytosine methylase